MKFLIAISFLFSLSAFANSERLSCKTENGEVEFTRDFLVTKATDKKALFDTIEAFKAEDITTYPSAGDLLTFKSSYEGQPGLTLTVKRVGKERKVAGEENACGVGFETNRFSLEVVMDQAGAEKTVRFTCHRFLGYHGHNCR